MRILHKNNRRGIQECSNRAMNASSFQHHRIILLKEIIRKVMREGVLNNGMRPSVSSLYQSSPLSLSSIDRIMSIAE
jgi:hypothetical protein